MVTRVVVMKRMRLKKKIPKSYRLSFPFLYSMAALQQLCLLTSPSSSMPTNSSRITIQLPTNLSANIPCLNPTQTKPLLQVSADLPLPLHGLPSDVREKILSLEIMGIDSGRALSLNPSLRTASPDSIHSVISFLLSKGLHHKDLGRILGMCPRILTSDIRYDLGPVFSFLSRDLRVPDSHFRRVVNKCPRLLISSVCDQLRPALMYLHRLGFRDITSLAYHDPVLLVSSVESTLMPKLQHLMSLGLSREEAVGMVLRCPGLFTFSIENNFKPKYEYFVKEMGGTLEELKDFPQYFAFSLEKRIKLRHRKAAKARLSPPLPLLLKSTDEEFGELLKQRGG